LPTILTHPAVPLALAWGLGQNVISKRLLAAGIVASVVPDLDVLAFRLGIPYAAEFGHRGFSHSLLLALIVALVGASLARTLHSTFQRSFWFLFVAMASHGILDAFTNGGLGIAFLWPFSGERFFAPFHPIEVAPLGLSRFLSSRGVAVLWSEVLWVWLPLFGAAAVAVASRQRVENQRVQCRNCSASELDSKT
jgi:inner membrane protein